MPATEQTWRNQKTMHVVFGASTLVMVLATVWLAGADHMREWKAWQLKERRKEAWMLTAQHDSLADQYKSRMDEHQSELRRVQSEPIDPALIEQFESEIVAEDIRLAGGPAGEEGVGENQVRPDLSDIDEVLERFNQAATDAAEARAAVIEGEGDAVSEKEAAHNKAESGAVKLRAKLLGELQRHIDEAKRREDRLVGRKKTANGKRTAAVSEKGIAVHSDATDAELEAIQGRINALDAEIAELTSGIAAAKDYRLSLESIVGEINAEEDALNKELSSMEAELDRLHEQVSKNTTNPLEWMTRLPVLDALYDGNIRIEQQWLPDLTINYNFSNPARFDRCTTCHRSIAATKPGTATEPAYPTLTDDERDLVVRLPIPAEKPADGATLRTVYGLQLADGGVIDDDAVTVLYVLPESPAARAGLATGDVLTTVRGVPVYTPAAVERLLVDSLDPEEMSEVEIEVRRGLDHPFTTHPRLDLYLTDLSPHPLKTFGCTICHDGQGSGTEFIWTSHTPNTAAELKEWIRKYGWFDNHHWIFPMKPARFAEANCLKCHHQKGGLEPSERFPDPPAPKLVEGWTLVEDYGCFGCHELNGYAGPDATIGPDVRLEPNYYEAAAQLLRDEGLNEEEQHWAERLISRPDDDQARQLLTTSVNRDADLAKDPETSGEARLSADSHSVAAVLKSPEVAGNYRKVGPSLRHLRSKVEFDWLYSWIRKPSDFRPTTKMPQFFLQYEHLTEPEDAAELAESERFEPIEMYALSWFLLNNSTEFETLEPPEEVTAEPSAERGRWLFESRGCLACHSHEQFPDIDADQGPDLSRIAVKFASEKGRQWLYTWLKQPNSYHTRTVMPDLYLDPIVEKDATGNPTGEVTDPAADIAAFLLGVETDWQPVADLTGDLSELSDEQLEALAELAQTWLASDAIPAPRAARYLQEGVPEALAPRLKADERLLVGITDENRVERHLEFVARRTISKYGCFGCHDIPGFESAKPIGTAIADWGRKETSKLAFENIETFLAAHGLHPKNELLDDGPWVRPERAIDAPSPDHQAHAHLNPHASQYTDDESYYVQAITSHSRDGFLWQKLRYPRSYDYKTTKNKSFNERLRMPRFPLTDEQREAVMTFVIGLVNEAPAEKYIYQPEPQRRAIVEGRPVLERFNCAGCHVLDMERWQFAYDEGAFAPPFHEPDFPFLKPHFSDEQYLASLQKDDRGMLHADLYGMPVVDEETGEPFWVDEDSTPITREELVEYEAEEGEEIPVFYQFQLWRNTLLDGEPRLVYFDQPLVPANRDGYGPAGGVAYPRWGGDLAHYLYPRVIEKAKVSNPAVDGNQAWGWLPPFLMDEGSKVQTDWLHGFLMDPTKLRPAAVMRMPNFHMSSEEATKLVNFFAAKSDVEFPYEYRPEQRDSYLASMRQQREEPLAEAMNIVVSGLYCVKCHAVAGFEPKGDVSTFGPNLANVYQRLRPTFIRDWIANPPRILPYTGMPQNIPYNPEAPHLGGVSQNLFKGTSIQQVDGLVNLLMNFDQYAKNQTTVTELVQEAATSGEAAAPEGDAQAAAPNDGVGDVLP